MKITKKYLMDWGNKQLASINDAVSLVDVKAINKNTHPVMGFVHKLLFVLRVGKNHMTYAYGFYTMKEIADHLDSGKYELYWKLRDGMWIPESTIELKKIVTIKQKDNG